MTLKELYDDIEKLVDKEVELEGWIRSQRKQKDFGFIDFSDGTIFKHIQIVYDSKISNFEEINNFHFGSAIKVVGKLIKSEGNKQAYEVKATSLEVLANCEDDYPVQPKRHTREFLREIAHLRPRTNLFQAVFRVRSVAAFAIHSYFQENGYLYVNTPLLTTADCEGSDQMFKVTTLNMDNVPKEDGKCDFSKDLFGKKTYITGSGQLHGEAFAMAFNKIYTFGPTFRTENSNTKTHANEFWMIEPEIAFCDLNKLMDIEEDALKYIVKYVLDKCPDEIEFLTNFVDNSLKEKLEKLVSSEFKRITHKDAVTLLKKASVKWEFEPEYGEDIAKEHEKYITEYYNCPVFVYNWPKDIKAWYMKLDDKKETALAVDLEVPGIGELIGGSERETDINILRERCKELGVDTEPVEWFMDLRRFGGCTHSGFGIGFERLIMYLTGIDNIRDVIPFPRTPRSCDF